MRKNYHHIKNVKKGWTKLPNAIRHDENLTSDAKVVIEELLSVSGDFHIHEAGIADSLHLSLVRVKNAIRLLKSTGYIQLTKVKDGSRFGGCEWGISDTAGTFQSSENHTLGNRTNGNAVNPSDNSDSSETDRMESVSFENLPIYQLTEGFQHTNNQQTNNQLTEQDEKPHHQPDVEEAAVSPASNKGVSSWGSSSEANASPLSGKNSSQAEPISQREYQYQQFLKKYPKAPLVKDGEETREAFFEATALDGSFAEIMAGLDAWCRSAEWRKDNGRWIKKPLNWLKERQWEKVNTLDAYMNHLDDLFSTEED